MYRLLHIDLFCGLSGWQAPFKESDRWRSVGLDIRDDLEADIVGDVTQLPLDCSPTLVTASPPCRDFTRWMLPWLDEPEPDLSLVRACLDAIEDLDPDYWIMENSRGLAMYWRDASKKVGPYYLWGEFPPFDAGGPDQGKMQVSGTKPEERAKIPRHLSRALMGAVEIRAQKK